MPGNHLSRGIRSKLLLLLTMFVISLFSVPAPAQQRKAYEDELARLDKQIQELRSTITTLEGREQGTIRTLEEARTRRQLHLREIDRLKVRMRQADEEIDQLENAIRENRQYIEAQKEQITHILRRLYKSGRFTLLKSLLQVQSARQLGLAHTYLSFLAKADFKAIEDFRQEVEELERNQHRLDLQKERLQTMLEQEQEHAASARQAAQEQERLLRDLRSRRELQIKTLQEKTAARAELEKLLEQLGEAETVQAAGAVALTALKGVLPWPVDGKIIGRFGKIADSVYKVEIENDGIDIQAPVGTPVTAIAAGTVVFSDWHDAGGNLVVLDHGSGYYSLYAHLSRFEVTTGKEVKAGEVLGAVGETGSLKGPILHFEIRKFTKGKGQQALDPLQWLRGNR